MRKLVARNPIAGMLLGAAVSALAVINSASAGPIEDGIEAFARGEYATALRLFRSLAERGDAQAEFNLGIMYAT
jgi:TPR repeat protein